jgi:hypothetical protein
LFARAQARLLERYGVEAASRFVEIEGPVRRVHVA